MPPPSYDIVQVNTSLRRIIARLKKKGQTTVDDYLMTPDLRDWLSKNNTDETKMLANEIMLGLVGRTNVENWKRVDVFQSYVVIIFHVILPSGGRLDDLTICMLVEYGEMYSSATNGLSVRNVVMLLYYWLDCCDPKISCHHDGGPPWASKLVTLACRVINDVAADVCVFTKAVGTISVVSKFSKSNFAAARTASEVLCRVRVAWTLMDDEALRIMTRFDVLHCAVDMLVGLIENSCLPKSVACALLVQTLGKTRIMDGILAELHASFESEQKMATTASLILRICFVLDDDHVQRVGRDVKLAVMKIMWSSMVELERIARLDGRRAHGDRQDLCRETLFACIRVCMRLDICVASEYWPDIMMADCLTLSKLTQATSFTATQKLIIVYGLRNSSALVCANPACRNLEEDSALAVKTYKCGMCETRYCCEECQGADWKNGHKGSCKGLCPLAPPRALPLDPTRSVD